MQAYMEWAQQLSVGDRTIIWCAALGLLFVYIYVDNWDVWWDDDDFPGPRDDDDIRPA
jgi:hypothetical protein